MEADARTTTTTTTTTTRRMSALQRTRTGNGVGMVQQAPPDVSAKMIIAGDSGVGKTGCFRRILEAEDYVHDDTLISTIGVDYGPLFFSHGDTGKEVLLQIWDTAGQERFRAITASYYRGADAVMLVYDVTDPASVRNVERVWLPEVMEYSRDDVKVVLWGNKTDLANHADNAAGVAETNERVQELLSSCPDIRHYRSSAKTGEGVDAAFAHIAHSLTDDKLARLQMRAAGGKAAAQQGGFFSTGNTVRVGGADARHGSGANAACCGVV